MPENTLSIQSQSSQEIQPLTVPSFSPIMPPVIPEQTLGQDYINSQPLAPLASNETPNSQGFTLDNMMSSDSSIKENAIEKEHTSQENASNAFGKYVSQEDKNKKSSFGSSGMSIPGALMLISLAFFLCVMFLGLSYVISKVSERAEGDEKMIESYENVFLKIDNLTDFPGIATVEGNANNDLKEDTLQQVVSSSIPFHFKRKIMEKKVDYLLSLILADSEELNGIQKEIAKYGFLDPEIMDIVASDENVIPIITSLHTVETVKFGTALKMFSLLDTFLSQSSRLLGVDKDFLESQMQLYASRGEKDVARFLSTCYLNPYEVLPDCNQIDDFANYFRYDEKDETIDSNLLAKILVIIDNKLEQSDLPSLQINFNRFMPNSKSLGFNIVVNTLPEDEEAFLDKGIINPHIFIISSLINLLKQSLFVIGDAINVKKLNIENKDMQIGDVIIPISTSSMDFDLPLQNSSEREIYDFYDPVLQLSGFSSNL